MEEIDPKTEIQTEERVSKLCEEVQKNLDDLSRYGYSGVFLMAAPDGRPFMADAGKPGDKLRLISNSAVASILYEDACTENDASHFMQSVVDLTTEKIREDQSA